jgi:hypothetical protein
MTARGRTRRLRAPDDDHVEWVGARRRMPFYVTDGEPHRPELVVWMQLPDGIVVAHDLVAPGDDPSVATTLRRAMQELGTTPQRLRVADELLAGEVRAAFGDRLDVRVAPTPEVDDLVAEMARLAPDGDVAASYLEEGRLEEATIAQMFLAAQTLYRAAPWKVADDQQVLRLDIPALDVDGACVSIIGQLGESLGLVVFPSYVDFERFLEAAHHDPAPSPDRQVDLGTTVLILDFWRRADLPPKMRAEVARHGWRVAGPKAYPMVTRSDRDGVPAPLEERDVRVATECALAVASFFRQHRALFAAQRHAPVTESSQLGAPGVTVRLTLPHDGEARARRDHDADVPVAQAAFQAAKGASDTPGDDEITFARTGVEAQAPAVAPGKVGRNEPCPCQSGKKYKKCCLDRERTARSEEPGRAALQALDGRLVSLIHTFAVKRFGDAWKSALLEVARWMGDVPELLQLAAPWTAYTLEMEGRLVLDWFEEDRANRLSPQERAWLAVQRDVWLGVWEILECEPGVGVLARDLLTGETRSVKEVAGSRGVVRRDVLLARVATLGEVSVFGGMFPHKLPPDAAAPVVEGARRRLRVKGPVTPSRVQSEALGRVLIGAWSKAVRELAARAARPPRLQNTDGEPLLFTEDLFAFEPGGRTQVEVALRTMENVSPPDDDDDPDGKYTFKRPGNAVHAQWDNTVVGQVWVTEDALRVATNSVARADALRRLVEEACGGLLQHRAREHVDPVSKLADPARLQATGEEPRSLASVQMLLEFKRAHYQSWPDQPLPALGGKTPREATRTARGREQVDLLLRTMENREQHDPDQAFDFADLRKELGLRPSLSPGSAAPPGRV